MSVVEPPAWRKVKPHGLGHLVFASTLPVHSWCGLPLAGGSDAERTEHCQLCLHEVRRYAAQALMSECGL